MLKWLDIVLQLGTPILQIVLILHKPLHHKDAKLYKTFSNISIYICSIHCSYNVNMAEQKFMVLVLLLPYNTVLLLFLSITDLIGQICTHLCTSFCKEWRIIVNF